MNGFKMIYGQLSRLALATTPMCLSFPSFEKDLHVLIVYFDNLCRRLSVSGRREIETADLQNSEELTFCFHKHFPALPYPKRTG